ncbi:MAG: hypothetical protein IJY09_01860, partial [Lachnospiraceae bacterium]|nr:hypothetical protein [Lachnospiraceae bacterium]
MKKYGICLLILFLLSLGVFTVLPADAATQNSITELKLKNAPKNNTMQAGGSYNFDQKVVACETKGKATTDVVYFEINPETNTAGAECLASGYAYPASAGEFQIRAVAFASKKDYQLWLKAKEKNDGKETAASKKYITAAS